MTQQSEQEHSEGRGQRTLWGRTLSPTQCLTWLLCGLALLFWDSLLNSGP